MRQKRKKNSFTHTRSQKNPSWLFKQSDNPVGLALAHIDALLDRIRLNKQKKFDEASINQLKKLTTKDLAEVNNKLNLTLEGIKGALSNDTYCKECFSFYDKPKMQLAVEYLKAIKAMKPDANANGRMA